MCYNIKFVSFVVNPIPWLTRYFLTHPNRERSVTSMEIPRDQLLRLTTKEGKLKLERETGSDANN